jgi:hypothetical protein
MPGIAPVNRIISLFLISGLGACSSEKSNAQSVAQSANTAVPTRPAAGPGCDASLWSHVYSPRRLQQLSPCLSATGIIEESSVDPDGDQHFLLKLDPGQDKLVNKRNQRKKNGDLVLEIVCANPTTMKKPRAACAGYTNHVALAPLGAHVTATGSYVLDSHNGWMEIHPVSLLANDR